MATLMEINTQNNNNIISSNGGKKIKNVKSNSVSTGISNLPTLINSEISTLYKIKKTQLKMLKLRGYDITREAHILTWNLHDFANIYINFAKSKNMSVRSCLSQIYDANAKNKLPACCVYYADVLTKQTFGKDDFCTFIEYLDKYSIRNGILITSKQLSSDAKKHKKKLSAYSIQVFLDREIEINPTEHYLVPKHIIVTDEERKNLESTNKNFNIADLPLIPPSDAIIKYIGAKKGEIIKIERFNILNGMVHKYIAYRVVQGLQTQGIEITVPEDDTNMI